MNYTKIIFYSSHLKLGSRAAINVLQPKISLSKVAEQKHQAIFISFGSVCKTLNVQVQAVSRDPEARCWCQVWGSQHDIRGWGVRHRVTTSDGAIFNACDALVLIVMVCGFPLNWRQL